MDVNSVAIESNMNMAPSTGEEGCQCVNETASLASLKERSCTISTNDNGQEEDGVLLTTEGPCVPHSYGSSSCLRHDELHDPTCNSTSSNASTPDYCGQSWCYVDALKCRQSSRERVYRSDYFSREDEVDMFYSYSTCNSTEYDWSEYQQANIHMKPLGGVPISAICPMYLVPTMFKLDLNANTMGEEYYDSNVPYKGIFVDYWDELMNISKGDLIINYTFASGANRDVHPNSVFTAAMQDVTDGLADMVVGQTWITEERLGITSFTLPLYYDKTVLATPDTTRDNATVYNRIFEPFHWGVWLVILLLIGTTALASVGFTWYGKRSLRQRKRAGKLKKRAYARLAVDEFLQKGTFFCSAGVEQDKGDTLPQKLLMFGFSFFILIVVSSYVANLAAFLTRPNEVITIETVNEMGKRVCAHPSLESELKVAWPKVAFVFEVGGDYTAMLKNYEEGKCDYLAVSESDLFSMLDLVNEYCKSGITLTDSVVLEIPVAFAIRPELAAGVSYWMHVGRMNHSITLESVRERNQHKYSQEAVCDLKFDEEAHQESNDYAEIKLENLAFPCFFYLGSLLLAIIVQLSINWHPQNGNEGESRGTVLLGRTSMLARQYTMSRRHIRSFRKDDDPEDEVPQSSAADTATNFVGGEDLALHDTVQHKNTNNSAHKQSRENRVTFSALHDTVQHKNTSNSSQNQSKGSSSRVIFENDDHLSDGSGEFHENGNNIIRSSGGGAVPLGEQNDATSRLLHLIDSGALDALDDVLDCVQDIRRQREG